MSRDKLLRRLSSLGFAVYECRLYIDTHPDSREAREMLENYNKKYEAVKSEYEKEYGALTLNGENSDDWLRDPWPWDNAAN